VSGLGLLLAPGAGADRNQPALVAIDQAATAEGIVVARMDFPYRKAGRKAPDRPPVLIDAVLTEASALCARAGLNPREIVLGGRSMGGRMCSLAVAGGLPARGLVLISYPLHPPGRPDQLRTDHFPKLDVPCLFVSGRRDAFGTTQELEAATASIPGPVTHHWIEGRDHGMRGADAEVTAIVMSWLRQLATEGRPRSRKPRRSG
jgi:predicted alpha/beta-hydrolase family hydrolase